MTDISKFKDHSYILRKNNCIERRTIKSYKYGSETVSNLGEKLWYMVPENNKKIQSLQNFKNKIRLRTLLNCSCKLCKTFVANSGYFKYFHSCGSRFIHLVNVSMYENSMYVIV